MSKDSPSPFEFRISDKVSVDLTPLDADRVRTHFAYLADRFGTRLCDDPECPSTETMGGIHEHVSFPARDEP